MDWLRPEERSYNVSAIRSRGNSTMHPRTENVLDLS